MMGDSGKHRFRHLRLWEPGCHRSHAPAWERWKYETLFEKDTLHASQRCRDLVI